MLLLCGENSSGLSAISEQCWWDVQALGACFETHLHKINLLTHLYLEYVDSRCGTAWEHLFQGKTELGDALSKSLPTALLPSTNAQSTGWVWSTLRQAMWCEYGIFITTCFVSGLPLFCSICPRSHCFRLMDWCQYQDYMNRWSWDFLYCCVKIREFPNSLHLVTIL